MRHLALDHGSYPDGGCPVGHDLIYTVSLMPLTTGRAIRPVLSMCENVVAE